MTPDEIKRHMEEYRRKALEHFPLKLFETTGENALGKWQELKSAGQGYPVVLGGDDDNRSFDNLLTPFGPNGPNARPPRSVDEILGAASGINFPKNLAERKKKDSEESLRYLKSMLSEKPDMKLPTIIDSNGEHARTYTREETIAAMMREPDEPPIGEWPDQPSSDPGLSVVFEVLSRKPLPKVYIGLAPTDDWTTIPAYLRWGGWNDCPAPEYHVAAMRAWRDRYSAELIGMNHDTINLRVAVKPQTREEALALARDQYIYCTDIIDQGFGSVSALAAALMANDWWYFWWD